MSDSTPIGYLDHVAFCVSDFEAQVAWYKQAFGLHEGEGERIYTEEPRTQSALLMSSDNGLCIEIFERPGSKRPPSSGEGPLEGTQDQGFHHWTLRVADLDASPRAARGSRRQGTRLQGRLSRHRGPDRLRRRP